MNDHEIIASKQQIKTAIKKIAGVYNVDVVELLDATVNSVDKPNRKVNVTPISGKGATPFDVGLMPECNDGEFKIPAIGSTVGVVMSDKIDPYIFSWSDLSEWYLVIGTTTIDVLAGTIKLGDGSFGGVIKISQLTSKLNALVAQTQAQLVAISAAIVSLGGSYAPGTLSTFSNSDYENSSITHGKT